MTGAGKFSHSSPAALLMIYSQARRPRSLKRPSQPHKQLCMLCGRLKSMAWAECGTKGGRASDLSEAENLVFEGAEMLAAGRGEGTLISLTRTGPMVCMLHI